MPYAPFLGGYIELEKQKISHYCKVYKGDNAPSAKRSKNKSLNIKEV
jgi:hypothetical protein